MMYTVLFYYTLIIMLFYTIVAATSFSAYFVSRRRSFLVIAIGFFFYFFDVSLVFKDDFVTPDAVFKAPCNHHYRVRYLSLSLDGRLLLYW